MLELVEEDYDGDTTSMERYSAYTRIKALYKNFAKNSPMQNRSRKRKRDNDDNEREPPSKKHKPNDDNGGEPPSKKQKANDVK